ncbi:MAG: NUDIX hydrolase [Anaerolineae bacterium]|nr:NUDIX hydrolase [Anaerolineae bacterium]
MTDNLNEKVITSRPIYEGVLIDLYDETVALPDGRTAKREIVRHPGAVAMVPLDGDNVILVRQFRLAAGKVMLEIPAGTLHPGEDPRLAAERELQEEIGFRAGTLIRLAGEFTAPGYTTEYIHIFLATDLAEAHLDKDDDEFIEMVTMPLDDALRRVMAGEIEDGKTIIGLLLAAQR